MLFRILIYLDRLVALHIIILQVHNLFITKINLHNSEWQARSNAP